MKGPMLDEIRDTPDGISGVVHEWPLRLWAIDFRHGVVASNIPVCLLNCSFQMFDLNVFQRPHGINGACASLVSAHLSKVVLTLVALRCSQPHSILKRNLTDRHSFYVWEGFPGEVTENMARRHLEEHTKA
jgi:hypothetical protein